MTSVRIAADELVGSFNNPPYIKVRIQRSCTLDAGLENVLSRSITGVTLTVGYKAEESVQHVIRAEHLDQLIELLATTQNRINDVPTPREDDA